MDYLSQTGVPARPITVISRQAARSDRRRRFDGQGIRTELDELLCSVSPEPSSEASHVYRRLSRLLGARIGATFCHLFTVDAKGLLTLQISAGPRPSAVPSRRALRFADLSPWHAALASGQTVVIPLNLNPDHELVRRGVFSPATTTASLVPFPDRAGRWGVLAVAEERAGMQPDVAQLEFIATRLGEIMERERTRHEERVALARHQREQAVLAERRRFSRELHDAVGQSLSTLLVQIRLATARGAAALGELQVIENITQQALEQARSLAYDLRQVDVDPLAEAHRAGERMLAQRGCAFEWQDDRSSREIGFQVAREVAAAIREAIANIARHAGATRASVRLESVGRRVRATIADNGIGFTADRVELSPDGRGLGLKGMSERLQAVGGSATVRSAPGRGTTIVLEASNKSQRPADQTFAMVTPRILKEATFAVANGSAG